MARSTWDAALSNVKARRAYAPATGKADLLKRDTFSLNCFKSGSWAKQATLGKYIDATCDVFGE